MNTKKDQYTRRKTKKVNIKERKPRKAKFQGQLHTQWGKRKVNIEGKLRKRLKIRRQITVSLCLRDS